MGHQAATDVQANGNMGTRLDLRGILTGACAKEWRQVVHQRWPASHGDAGGGGDVQPPARPKGRPHASMLAPSGDRGEARGWSAYSCCTACAAGALVWWSAK